MGLALFLLHFFTIILLLFPPLASLSNMGQGREGYLIPCIILFSFSILFNRPANAGINYCSSAGYLSGVLFCFVLFVKQDLITLFPFLPCFLAWYHAMGDGREERW
ncbi:hypothetical protein L873DRAFT_1248256 [Choiromyces venosus 120613-1]|uniref:Uncharacterized protein n=1 Tax=Choiromyces venosus 120613-1 TaxID=1336337 RepID=A0A3N4JIC9_9PEZI|nr:hypothetical protein L873DRAFT_1248256 [Choiromyces venosus 120613-1]